MIPTYQKEYACDTSVNKPGDCLRAAVASILQLPIKQVPHFIKRKDYKSEWNKDWWQDLVGFLNTLGYEVHCTKKAPWTGYNIGVARMKHFINESHAVVCWAGTIVHNPSENPRALDAMLYHIYWEGKLY